MDVVETLDRSKSIEWLNEEGEPQEVTFRQGFSAEAIERLEQSLEVPLPRDFRDLASHCRAIEGAGVELDLRNPSVNYWVEDILPFGLPIAHDGFGNCWVIDCRSVREERSSIFYVCHDPSVMIFQGKGLAEFLAALPAFDRGDSDSPVWRVWSEATSEVWFENPGLLALEEALASSDPALRGFAEEIGEPCHIVDLRGVEVGMGFSWGRYGMDTPIRRFGEERIFAYKRPSEP